jgi:uncharacterized protein (TIGR02444 family)
MSSAPIEMNSPLWRFSLAVYASAGVQEECLDVQERIGVDVNLLMLCAYVGAVEGAVLSASDVADAIEASGAWHGNIVKMLRQVRRTLKPWGAGQGGVANAVEGLRVKVKGAELEAEQIEQAMMWRWLRARDRQLRQREPHQALAANVFALLVRCGATGAQADPLRALPHLCAAAVQAGARDPATGTGA